MHGSASSAEGEMSCRSKSSALPPGNAAGSLLSPEAWQALPDGLLLPHLADGTANQVPEQDAAAVHLKVGSSAGRLV